MAMADERVRKFLATDQTLEDYSVIIQSVKANYSAHKSPVIVVGMGYAGGMNYNVISILFTSKYYCLLFFIIEFDILSKSKLNFGGFI